MIRILTAASALVILTAGALAAPTLRGDIAVSGPIVTVGDMFDDAGELAETGLFRAPSPGTTGTVSLEQLRLAADRAGLVGYDTGNVARIRVTRSASYVDAALLTELIEADLRARGIVRDGITMDLTYRGATDFTAEAVAEPVETLAVRYTPGNGAVVAQFAIAGYDSPVEVLGTLELMIEAPHLATSKPAGALLMPDDIEMRPIPLRFAESSPPATLEQLIGMQLTRQSRAGMLLKATDVAEPLVIERNAQVTLILETGPMRLTARGQALGTAAVGQPVQVLNSTSNKIVTGVARADGTVAVTTSLEVAGL